MSSTRRFPKLFESGRIGQLELRNRIVMAPMGTNLGELDGCAGKRVQRYYEERARGGAGLVIVGVAAVAHPRGRAIPRQIGISDDRFLDGLARLASRVRRHGARVAVQLQHAGKIATQDIAAGWPLLVPSVIPYAGGAMADLTADEMERLVANVTAPGAKLHYRELSAGDIAELVDTFAAAAERAKRAGFDGVEVHAGHGYLISAFLSRATNRRTDAYGGAAENRARFLVEVIQGIRDRVGLDFPVWCRLDACEYRIEDGITIEESIETARLAEAAGADAIHVSAYGNPFSGIAFTEAPLVHAPGGFLPFAEAIKGHVEVPVIAVGRITPERGEQALREGKADFIAMGRKLLADPELPNKLREGRVGDIRPCVYCYTCVGNIFVNESVACTVNPAVGRETELELEPARRAKTVLIAGGGPAGMEAARVAALCGHRVVLCERERRLGGALRFSALFWEANGDLVDYLERQVRELPIDLRLGKAVAREVVAEVKPEVILVAAGSTQERPAVPGVDLPRVLGGDELRGLIAGRGRATSRLPLRQRMLMAMGRAVMGLGGLSSLRTLSRYWLPLGRRIAIIGGGMVGVEVAEFLVERGRSVTVIEEGERLAADMAIPRRWRSLHELRERGATLLTGTRVEEIFAGGVTVITGGGARRTLEVDHVVIASGAVPDRRPFDALAGGGQELHLLGDCREVRHIEGSIADAVRVGRAL